MWGFLARNRLIAAVALAAFAADQVTKAIIVATVPFGRSWPDSGFLRFTHVGNTGSAFGLFDGRNSFLIFGALLGLAVLVYFYRSHPNPGRLVKLSMGLMLAGAVGNLTDRIFRDHVVDFVDVGPFWIFNVADASITVGLAILAVSVLLVDQGKPAADEPAPAADAASEPASASLTDGETSDDQRNA